MNLYYKMTIENAKAIEKLVQINQNQQTNIDKLIENSENLQKMQFNRRVNEIEDKLKILRPVLTICYYPKISIVIFLLISALYISDSRELILKMIGIR